MKYLVCAILAFFIGLETYAQKRGKGKSRVFEILQSAKNPDKNHDYKVDSPELRNWVNAVSAVYSHPRGRLSEGLEKVAEFDLDKNQSLSSKEQRRFRDHMKEVFERASKQVLLENDINKNRRLDKSELKPLSAKIPSFLEYSLENHAKQEELENVQVAEKKESIKRKYAIDDIYD